MKRGPFIILMAVLLLMLAATGTAVVRTLMPRKTVDKTISTAPAEEIHIEELTEPDDGRLRWQDPRIEVGTLTYTITKAEVVYNVNHAGPGKIREGAALYIYGDDPENPAMYFHTGTLDVAGSFLDEEGNIVPGGSMVFLQVLVESEDAVNFVTDPVTGVQDRRYEDNPFLFRADEICYIIDSSEDESDGYIYYDAAFFSDLGKFSEHDMAYELLPGESIEFRIGFLLGNRQDGSELDHSDLVISTLWNDKEEEYFDLGLQ